jgi:tRNA A-37 threonylcarbamoyl transferase component Bud32
METVTRDSISGVSRLSLHADYYVKKFNGRKDWLKQLLGISRFQRERRNLKYFGSLGLATPAVVAIEERRVAGCLQSGTIVTAAIVDSVTLEELIQSGEFYRGGRVRVRQLLKKLALSVRALHKNGFFHRDIKTRNILVGSYRTDCTLYFFDCPSGYHPPSLLLKRCIVRDLAYLERGMRGYVGRSDLLYLFKTYLGKSTLSTDDKALARAILAYYGNRRMTRKRRERITSTRKNTT